MTKGEGKRKKIFYRWYIGEFFILIYQLKVTKITGYPVSGPTRYPALRKAGYPAKSVSGVSLPVDAE